MVEQKTERKLSIPLYVGAFLVTMAIFLVGTYVGNLISENSRQGMSNDITKISSRLTDTQLLFLLDNSSSFCPVYNDALSKLDDDTELIGQKLAFLEDKYGTVDEKLKLQYFDLETDAYFLSKKVNEKCNDSSTLVLYFYSNKNCRDCKQEGETLLDARSAAKKKVKIYSFDGDMGSPVVTALKKKYSVSVYPTILINEIPYSGYQSLAQLSSSFEKS